MTTMRSGTSLDPQIRDAYLARLGFRELPSPTRATLFAIHRAHVERVPYETVWIALGEPRGIDLLESAARMVNGTGAGGYCYQLNGAMSLLLEWLGFSVHRHCGGVQPNPSPANPHPVAGANGNHLALTVELPDGTWLVDAGLGDALHEPLRLVEGEVVQEPFTFRIRPSESESGGWRFDHDRRGSFSGFDLRPGPVTTDELAVRHTFLSTSPESGFVRVVTAQRRDATGVDCLRGRVLTRIGPEPDVTRELASEQEWRAVLGDVFGMSLAHVDPVLVTSVWERICTDHAAFLERSGQD